MSTDFEKVDDTIFGDEDDANTIFIAIKRKAARYQQIGGGFGLAPSTIDSIKDNHPKDNSGALREVVTTWVRQEYDTDRFAPPSWKRLVEVISEIDKLLAKQIARQHLIQPTCQDSTSVQMVEDTYYSDSPLVTTDGSSVSSRVALPLNKSTKKVVAPSHEEFEPLDRKNCLTKPLQFKFDTVCPRANETKIIPLSGAYEMKSECHGLAVIISNEKFAASSKNDRPGADVDEENLLLLLRFLGYRVRVYRNVDSSRIKSIFEEVQQFDHSPYDSFVSCILSHGDKDVVYGTNGVRVNIGELTGKLNGDKCPKLVGKPKLFFFQTCRGEVLQTRVMARIVEDGTGTHPSNEFLPNTADFFFSFAVPRGYKSFHHTVRGSWYVTELCRALGEHATYAPLMEIMHLVHQNVANKYAETHNGEPIVQAPEIISRLRKHIFFF